VIKAVLTLFALTWLVPCAARAENVVSRIQDGDVLTVATTNGAGQVANVERLRFVKNIRGLVAAPIGSTYVPTTERELRELQAATKEELLVEVPEWQTASAPHYWQQPRAVLLARGSLKVIGITRSVDCINPTESLFSAIDGEMRDLIKSKAV